MITFTKRISYSLGETIKIKPIFDVHLGNKYCDKVAFKRFLSTSDSNTYFIGGGDFFDAIVVQDIRYRKAVDATAKENIIDEQIDMGEELLRPYKDKIIGLGTGNHEATILRKCGTDMIWRLCKRLDCKYLGYSYIVRLIFHENNARTRAIIIKGHHGWGGGSRTQGADLTKFSKDMQHWVADIFLYGHVHRKQSDRVPRLGLVGNKLVSRPKLLGICGTFLKTYTDSTNSTYSEEKGYPPVEIGGITVHIRPESRKFATMWIDV